MAKGECMKAPLFTFLFVVNVSIYILSIIFINEYPRLFPYFLLFSFSLSAILISSRWQQFKGLVTSLIKGKIIARSFNALLVISVLAILNYWSFKFPKQWDFTKAKTHTLTQQTKKILHSMNKELKFTMATIPENREALKAMVELYKFEKRNLEITEIDIVRRPDLVAQFQLNSNAAFIIEYEKRFQVVRELTELSIANALIKLSRPQELTIGVTLGHKEVDFYADNKDGMSSVRTQLEMLGYRVVTLPLFQMSEIPANIKTLIIWGPKSGLIPEEIKVLNKYFEKGGNILFALDPDVSGDPAQAFRDWFKSIGIDVKNTLVIDELNNVNGSKGSIPIIKSFSNNSEIVKNFEGQVFFPYVSSVSENLEWQNKGGSFTSLAETSIYPKSYAETSLEQIRSGNFSFGAGDLKGPIGVAGVFERDLEKGISQKIVVFGNSSFALNSFKNISDNTKLFLNSVSFASGENRLVSFDIPTLQDSAILMSPSEVNIAFYFSILFIPVVLISLSITVFRYRSVG